MISESGIRTKGKHISGGRSWISLGLGLLVVVLLMGTLSWAARAAGRVRDTALVQHVQDDIREAQANTLSWLAVRSQQAITLTEGVDSPSGSDFQPAAPGDLGIIKAVTTAAGDGTVFNGDRITYTLTIVNQSGRELSFIGAISVTDEIPLDVWGQVQIDQIRCEQDCVLENEEEIVLSPTGAPVVVTVTTGVHWAIEAITRGQTLTISAGETITREFSGRVAGQADGTVIENSAYVLYDVGDGTDVSLTAEPTETIARVRATSNGDLGVSDAPTWLSRDAGGTLSVDWGDFDLDGDLDLVLASTVGTTVYQNQDGRLVQFWDDGQSRYTLGVRWADVTNDGYLDIVAVGESISNSAVTAGTNYVYALDTGQTAFVETDVFASPYQLLRVEPADYTGDGWIDLIVSTNAIDPQCPVRLFRNRRRAANPFETSRCVSTEPTANIAAGDYNNDDWPDLATGEFPNVTKLLVNSSGVLTAASPSNLFIDTTTTFLGYDFAWGDYDRDGFLDLAVAFPIDRRVRIYHNEGGTDLVLVADSLLRTNLFYTPLALDWGDFDGDGLLDLAVADSPPAIYINTGDPAAPFSIQGGRLQLPGSAVGGQIWSLAAADQDNDGDLDLAFGNRDGASLLFTSFAPFLDSELAAVDGSSWSANSVAWGDADADGDLDLLFGSAAASPFRTRLYPNEAATFGLPSESSIIESFQQVAFGTMDSDDLLDIAVAGVNRGLQIYLDGNLSSSPVTMDSGAVTSLAWGDSEGDGDLDLLVGRDGTNLLYVNDGTTLSSTPLVVSTEDDDTQQVAWGDYDGDGYLDIAVGNDTDPSRIYHNDGGNTFSLRQTFASGYRTTSVAWGDVDGDGDLDLAVGNDGGENRIYRNEGGTLVPAWTSGAANNTSSVAWGDWDNDGDLDLAVGNNGQPDRVYGNQGTSPDAIEMVWLWTSDVSYQTSMVAWGDVDNDGDLDLAASQQGSGQNGVYRNNLVVPSHLDDVFVPTMPLPNSPSYVSVSRPGSASDGYLYSSAEILRGESVSITFRTYDPDGTRAGTGSDLDGDEVISATYEYSLDGGGTWLPATAGGAVPSLPFTTRRLGTQHTFAWNPVADEAISDNARFRVTIVHLNETGPMQRAATSAVSPPFRVQATTCYWPVGPSFTVDPPDPDPGEEVVFGGSILQGSGALTFTWDFGDGTTATGQRVAHIYNGSNTYDVRMSVSSEPCPRVGIVTTTQNLVVGSGMSGIYLPLVMRSYGGGTASSASDVPLPIEFQISGGSSVRYRDDERLGLGQKPTTDEPVAPPVVDGVQPSFSLAAAFPATPTEVLLGNISSTVPCTDITSIICSIITPTSIWAGIHSQPSINGAGDQIAFWSTGNLGDIPARFDYAISMPPILLVDDDNNWPDVRGAYQAALNMLPTTYDVWDTRGGYYVPDASTLARYSAVIWFTGNRWGGPSPAAELALATYLDAGGHFFVSSQDYYYGRGFTPFMDNYLGVGAVDQDVQYVGVRADSGPYAPLNPTALAYYVPHYNYADWLYPDAPSSGVDVFEAFRGYMLFGAPFGPAAVAKATDQYKTTFLGFPLEVLGSTGVMRFVLRDMQEWFRLLGTVAINEISLAGQEAIELFNYGTVAVDMRYWDLSIEHDSGTLHYEFPSFSLGPGAYVVIHDGNGTDTSTDLYLGTDITLSRSNDGSVSLSSAEVGIAGVDFVGWGGFTQALPAGTDWSGSLEAPAQHNMGRGNDTDRASNWCEQLDTLGARNPGCGEGTFNQDGNIEAFLGRFDQGGDVGFTQVSSSTGSILGGFNLWPSVNSEGGYVAFFSDGNLTGGNEDGNFEVFLYNSGGGSFIQVTDSRECVSLYPSISGDGSTIAFASDCDHVSGSNPEGNQEIFLAEIRSGNQVSITQISVSPQSIVNDQPVFSDDGARLAYVYDVNNEAEVRVYDITVDPPNLVFSYDAGTNTQPALDADGSRVVFASKASASDAQEIVMVDMGAAPQMTMTQITSGTPITVVNDQPSISGNGYRIAFVTDSGADAGIWVYDLGEMTRTRISSAGDSNSRPSISANGRFVAFAAERNVYRAEFPLIDLAVMKRSEPSVFVPGKEITYTVTVTNYGPSDAPGVVVSDTIPDVFVITPTWTCSPSSGATCSGGTGYYLMDTVFLPVGGEVIYTIRGTLDPAITETVVNVAEVIGPPVIPEHILTNNRTPPDSKVPTPESELLLVKTGNPDPAIAGTVLTYTLTYANAEPSDAQMVYITDTLPQEVVFGGQVGPSAPFAQTGAGQASWLATTLPASETGSIVFTVTVQSDYVGELSNTAEITSAVYDPNPGNNVSALTTTVTTLADLEISKRSDPVSVDSGEVLTYTVVYTNHGPSDALDVVITDVLPISVTWGSVVGAVPEPTVTGSQLVWDVGPLVSGQSGQLVFTVTVTDTFTSPGEVANQVLIASATPDPVPGNNDRTLTTTVTLETDLSIVKASDPDPAVPGQVLTYTIVARNLGDLVVPDAVISDTLPDVYRPNTMSWSCIAVDGSTVIPATGTGDISGTIDFVPHGIVTCTVVGTLSPSAHVSRDGVTNTATITVPTGYSDSDPSNNSSTVPTGLSPEADLAIAKSRDSAPAIAGTVVTYTLTYSNSGPSYAQNVTITDRLTDGLAYGGVVSGPQAALESGQVVTWSGFTLTDTETGSIVFTATIRPEVVAGTSITNSVSITSAVPDPLPGDNSADAVSVTVTTEVDLAVSKSALATAVAGEWLTYTIVYTNNGPSLARDIVVTDTLPLSVTVNSFDPTTMTLAGRMLIWQDPLNLSVGASRMLTVVVDVDRDVGPSLTNVVTVTSSVTESDATDNWYTSTVPVYQEVDLSISKTALSTVVAGETLTYTIVYTNSGGPSVAHSVEVTDQLSADVQYGEMLSGSSPAEAGQLLTWTVGDLAVDGTGTLVFTVSVDSDVSPGSTITNQVGINSVDTELNAADNTDEWTTSASSVADLSISKSDQGDPVSAGGTLTYTLSYTNAGPSDAWEVYITDTLPVSVTMSPLPGALPPFDTVSESPTNVWTWYASSLSAGASGWIVFTVDVTNTIVTTDTITNTVTIDSISGPPDNANQSTEVNPP